MQAPGSMFALTPHTDAVNYFALVQARHEGLLAVQGALEKELGAGTGGQPLHVVLSKLAARTERMDDDVAYLLIGAKTMLSEKLLKDVFATPP